MAVGLLNEYRQLKKPHDEKALQISTALSKIRNQGSKDFQAVFGPIKDEIPGLIFDGFYKVEYEEVQAVLNRLYDDFLAAYNKHKREIGALDFLDLEEIAVKILQSDQSLIPVDHALIDEAQDLNPVQWKLIGCLEAKGVPIFMVGDIQQSIYGFRHADVELFNDRAIKAAQGEGKEILLHENWRSRKTLLTFVNGLFERSWTQYSRSADKIPSPSASMMGLWSTSR